MALATGTKLGPYEITGVLGAGGMGEVYRARDTRLDRTVAVKVLPTHLSSSPDLRQRFEREAQVISSLSHPHICTLHDVGQQDGIDYLVMEYLQGETLADRLARSPLPLQHGLIIAIEIADALDKAHTAGVAHRDLKPSNIMLTPAGAKLLDFGLAKSVGTAAAAGLGSGPVFSAAVTLSSPSPQSPATATGTIVGTIQYMSPEQIEGRQADARSDIFAFGAVLYEMVTGHRAFQGKSQVALASAILEKEPEPITAIQCTASATLDHVIRTCLAKNREERFRSIFDVKLELEYLAEMTQRPSPGAPRKQWRERLAWVAAAALVIIALALTGRYYENRTVPSLPLRVSVVSPAGVFPATAGKNGPPRISPEGTRFAFVGCKTEAASQSLAGGNNLCSIWVHSLESGETHEVSGTGGGYSPFWSPDGREIGFFGDGKVKRVAAEGGPVQILCDAESGRGGSWAKDTIIFTATRTGPIFRVPADGGTPRAITHPAPSSNPSDDTSHRWTHFLPDGEHFLYLNSPNGGACSDLNELHLASLDAKQDVAVLRSCSDAEFAAGHLIYWRDGNLVAQPFDDRRGVLNGAAVALAQHVAFDALFGFGEFSASHDGKLLYMTGESGVRARLIWYDRVGATQSALGENEDYESIAISRDGASVVANSPGKNIRVMDSRGTRTLITFDGYNGGFPAWSADGRQIYFTSNANGPYDIFVKAANGSDDQQLVVRFEKGQPGAAFLSTSPDGKYLAYVSSDSAAKRGIYTVPLTGERKPHPFLHSSANESAPAFSPDGKWLAFESTQSGRSEVYVTPFPNGGAQYQVSTNGGERPVWRRDGKEIFYREDLRLMAVEVRAKNTALELGSPKPLFEVAVRNLGARWYDVSPDGRFLINTSLPRAQSRNFELLVNWPAELKK